MRLFKYVLVLAFFTLFSCTNNEDGIIAQPVSGGYSPGVVITLDDDYVDNWAAADDILKAYNWKATFFVTKCSQLDDAKMAKLTVFKQYGHEIGGHGLNHINAPQFIAANNADAYLKEEIFSMVDIMDAAGLHTTSFAYPFGARNAGTDNLLLNHFSILRGTTYGRLSPNIHNCYYTGSPVVFGLGIDNSYSHFNVSYFLSLLEYAKNNNKIVVFYAHRPVQTSHNDYETEYNTLVEICKYVKANNMKFYTISELPNL